MATPLTAIPAHLLAEILLRLPATGDLARGSAACVSFRRLVTDGAFLRRFRRLHGPPLLGFLDHHDFNPAIPPHPSASGARALALAADFSFSFLPSHCRWTVQDTRDGRVLLDGTPEGQARPLFMELVVCDPLHRQYILLPPVPDDLAASLEHPIDIIRKPRCMPFLVPVSEEETSGVEETTFRVIWMAHCKMKLSAFVFSSSTGQWRMAASKPWTDLVFSNGELDIMSQVHPFLLRRHYAHGCFYWDWLIIKSKKLLVLDTRRMEFSVADLPPGEWSARGLAIAEVGEGKLGVFGFDGGSASDLSYAIARNEGGSCSQFQMEKTISLDDEYKYCITNATERYLLLRRTNASYLENRLVEYLSMDVKTLKLQRVCVEQDTHMQRAVEEDVVLVLKMWWPLCPKENIILLAKCLQLMEEKGSGGSLDPATKRKRTLIAMLGTPEELEIKGVVFSPFSHL